MKSTLSIWTAITLLLLLAGRLTHQAYTWNFQESEQPRLWGTLFLAALAVFIYFFPKIGRWVACLAFAFIIYALTSSGTTQSHPLRGIAIIAVFTASALWLTFDRGINSHGDVRGA